MDDIDVNPNPTKAGPAQGIVVQARSSGDGKERILLAALEEFAARGFDGASTTAIARRSGVTQPLIHYHFGSKEGLWRATVNEAFSRLRDEFLAAVQRNPPMPDNPRGTALALVREFVRFCGRYPHFPRLLYTELPVASTRSAWLMDTWVTPVVTQIVAMHPSFARESGMPALPIGHVMAALTGAAATFFALGDFMKTAYGLDPADEATIEAHADTVVMLFEGGLFRRA
jgi:TetR/AcrR family transcriptional regulator